MSTQTHAEKALRREMIEMMQRCKSEIIDLRRQVERLQPKADAYDNLTTVLRLLPRPSQGMSEDLAWALERRIEKLASEEKEADAAGIPVTESEGA